MKVILILLCLLLSGCHLEAPKKGAAVDYIIPVQWLDYRSSNDQDGDGVDDASDLLKSVRAYVATDPIYKSVYYDGGYPNDGYGVCTDVVGAGCLGAGYDLRVLVDDHIRQNPNLYNLERVDDNIDFRRVTNLLVFFRENFIELTIDPTKTEEWMPGDILVMDGHVGIVSDKRTVQGMPLVIHHTEIDPHIREENLIETREDIIAHFRVSERLNH